VTLELRFGRWVLQVSSVTLGGLWCLFLCQFGPTDKVELAHSVRS